MCPPVNPPRKVLLYTKFPIGREPITKEPDIKSGSLAKNGSDQLVFIVNSHDMVLLFFVQIIVIFFVRLLITP